MNSPNETNFDYVLPLKNIYHDISWGQKPTSQVSPVANTMESLSEALTVTSTETSFQSPRLSTTHSNNFPAFTRTNSSWSKKQTSASDYNNKACSSPSECSEFFCRPSNVNKNSTVQNAVPAFTARWPDALLASEFSLPLDKTKPSTTTSASLSFFSNSQSNSPTDLANHFGSDVSHISEEQDHYGQRLFPPAQPSFSQRFRGTGINKEESRRSATMPPGEIKSICTRDLLTDSKSDTHPLFPQKEVDTSRLFSLLSEASDVANIGSVPSSEALLTVTPRLSTPSRSNSQTLHCPFSAPQLYGLLERYDVGTVNLLLNALSNSKCSTLFDNSCQPSPTDATHNALSKTFENESPSQLTRALPNAIEKNSRAWAAGLLSYSSAPSVALKQPASVCNDALALDPNPPCTSSAVWEDGLNVFRLSNQQSNQNTRCASYTVTRPSNSDSSAESDGIAQILNSISESAYADTQRTPVKSTCEILKDDSALFHEDGSLRLDIFKVFPCNGVHCGEQASGLVGLPTHDRKTCPFYHSQRDRRRYPFTAYKAEQCEHHFDLETDGPVRCPMGDKCDKCHNRHELLYHPDIYKQRFCSSYNQSECHRGPYCAFAHTRKEIRCKLFSKEDEDNPNAEFFMLHFKTLWCPYGTQHDWHGCLYAHTYQDCRRTPAIKYGSEPCPHWKKDFHSADYQKRCQLGPRCCYAHGSKEQLYHPAYYKTMPCADFRSKGRCPRRVLCAFYHNSAERRYAPQYTYVTSTELPAQYMSKLQTNFLRPPLFNLDDFEAFGRSARLSSGNGNTRWTLPKDNAQLSTFPLSPLSLEEPKSTKSNECSTIPSPNYSEAVSRPSWCMLPQTCPSSPTIEQDSLFQQLDSLKASSSYRGHEDVCVVTPPPKAANPAATTPYRKNLYLQEDNVLWGSRNPCFPLYQKLGSQLTENPATPRYGAIHVLQ